MKLNEMLDMIGMDKIDTLEEASITLIDGSDEDLGSGRSYPKYFKVGNSKAMQKYSSYANGNDSIKRGPFDLRKYYTDYQETGRREITNMGKHRRELMTAIGIGTGRSTTISKWTGFTGGIFTAQIITLLKNMVDAYYDEAIGQDNGSNAFSEFDWISLEYQITALLLDERITNKALEYNTLDTSDIYDVRHPFTIRGMKVGSEPTIAAFFANEAVKGLQKIFLLSIRAASPKEKYVNNVRSARGLSSEIASTASGEEERVLGYGNSAYTPDDVGRSDPRTS